MIKSQTTNFKVVSTFHVPPTWNPGKSSIANGTAERACYFCRLRHGGACLLHCRLWQVAVRRFAQGYVPVEQAASLCFFGLLQAGSLCYALESDAQLRKH